MGYSDLTKLCFSLIVIAIILPLGTLAANRRIIELRSGPLNGPPNRPDQFKTVDELERYLADLAEYYKMMSRPRFGKRSQEMPSSLAEQAHGYDSNRLFNEQSASAFLWRLLPKINRGTVYRGA